MPSLRKRVSTYLRQLSFHNEPRDKKHHINENSFVTKYLQGQITLKEGPQCIYGKNPTDLPNYELGKYDSGPDTVIGCYSGPNGGLTTVKRIEKHLSVLDADIDFIDTTDDVVVPTISPKKSPIKKPGQPIDNTKMVIKVAGNEYSVTNMPKKSHNKSHSLGSLGDFNIEIEKTRIDRDVISNNNNEKFESLNTDVKEEKCDNKNEKNEKINQSEEKSIEKTSKPNIRKQSNARKTSIESTKSKITPKTCDTKKSTENYNLSKSKSEGNPFNSKRKGKIIKITQRPNIQAEEPTEITNVPTIVINDSRLPTEWNKKSDFIYGLSDSLYDRNQVTKNKNGDPIADCFGIIARNDSAILAVADGVNWGEKACIAAKSAVHGCLHYLDKTIFNDTKPFENLTVKNDDSAPNSLNPDITRTENLIKNTREVFVCLLRAFNCAHDLILENKGMLTTLTVAIVLPLRQKVAHESQEETRYVCCVCNVGDTLAYVYSQKYGVRELTKGSHDINSNRDMRDALGALGPVDGISPELSNLTLSITTLSKGDIVMVASDGLTDNFDPNVCKFSTNTACNEPQKPKRQTQVKPPRTNLPNNNQETKPKLPETTKIQDNAINQLPSPTPTQSTKPPIKPPRRSKNRDDISERSSIKSTSLSIKSTSTIESNSVSTPVTNPPLETHFTAPKPLEPEITNPLISQFIADNPLPPKKSSTLDSRKTPLVLENKASSLRKQTSSHIKEQSATLGSQSSGGNSSSRGEVKKKTVAERGGKNEGSGGGMTSAYKFLRSKTSVDFSRSQPSLKHILRNPDGVPLVTPIQRYELQLLLIEDVLRNGISGKDSPCTSAKKLCENLVSFTLSITSAKRHTLEDPDLYFDNRNGVLVECSGQEKKIRRKKGLDKVQNLPGKLDHVTVVAYNVGNYGF